MMLPPWSEIVADTAATILGRSGQEITSRARLNRARLYAVAQIAPEARIGPSQLVGWRYS
jgi:hypothetical protein